MKSPFSMEPSHETIIFLCFSYGFPIWLTNHHSPYHEITIFWVQIRKGLIDLDDLEGLQFRHRLVGVVDCSPTGHQGSGRRQIFLGGCWWILRWGWWFHVGIINNPWLGIVYLLPTIYDDWWIVYYCCTHINGHPNGIYLAICFGIQVGFQGCETKKAPWSVMLGADFSRSRTPSCAVQRTTDGCTWEGPAMIVLYVLLLSSTQGGCHTFWGLRFTILNKHPGMVNAICKLSVRCWN